MQRQIQEIESDVIAWRRELHQIPELGLELPQTTAFVREKLEEMKIPYENLVDNNAIVAFIQGDQPGKTLAIRADMDALPIREETDFDFKSTNGNMHACGHDAHTAMLLGAAKILSENRHQLKGNVKLLFQPGEEYPGGAKPMIDEGCLENPKVDAIIGLHAGIIHPNIPNGHIGVNLGQSMACMDRFKVTVNGKGAHGAYPETSIDPIAISNQIINDLYRIKSREISAVDPVVVSVCQIHGGSNQNIIPDSVFFEGTSRATSAGVREKVAQRIREISVGVAHAMGAEAEVEYDFKYPPLVNDETSVRRFTETATSLLGQEKIHILDKPIMGGEDFAFFAERVPAVFFFLSNTLPLGGVIQSHHTSKFALDESHFKTGISLFVQFAFDFLSE